MRICLTSMKKCLWTCSDDDKGLPLPSGKGVSCWICLGEGPDGNGEPLRRDCSCRGDSGYAHLSCIVGYGEERSRRYGIEELSKPWSVCTICHQEYQGELAVDLASKFVTFLERNYPGDQSKLLDAFFLKLSSMDKLSGNHNIERKQVAERIFSTIEQMKTQTSSLPQRISLMEASLYNEMGRTYNLEGTREGAKKAMESFEKCRDISKEIGDAAFVAVAESNIAVINTDIDGSIASYARWIQKQQELYEQRNEKFGEGSQQTIEAGLNLAIALYSTNRWRHAERLLTKLAATSNRVHGSDHRVTKEVTSRLRSCKMKRVTGKLKVCMLLILFALVFWFMQIYIRWYGPSHYLNDEGFKGVVGKMFYWAMVYLELMLVLMMLDIIYANSR